MKIIDRHQEVSRLQARQQLKNCALLVAYVHGQPGGWYGVASGHIDGFRSDYALVHSEPGNIELHRIRSFYLDGAEECLEELEQIRDRVASYNDADKPLVTTLTEDEKAAAVAGVRAALSEEQPEDVEAWLRELCDAPSSDLSFCNWGAVAAAVGE